MLWYKYRERETERGFSPACSSAAQLSAARVKDNNLVSRYDHSRSLKIRAAGDWKVASSNPQTGWLSPATPASSPLSQASDISDADQTSPNLPHLTFVFVTYSQNLPVVTQTEHVVWIQFKEIGILPTRNAWKPDNQNSWQKSTVLRCGPGCAAGAACDLD